MSSIQSNSFYDNTSKGNYSDILAVEIAILQQDIELPELPEEKLTLDVLRQYEEEGKEYLFAQDEYVNMVGNFYIPVLFPLVENGESTELLFDAPSTANIISTNFATAAYTERNFIALTIPKYILLNFKKVVPAGTKFLVAFVGGSTKIININIIGLYGPQLSLEDGQPIIEETVE